MTSHFSNIDKVSKRKADQMMKRIVLAALLFVACPLMAAAQDVIPGQSFAWEQAGPDLATVQGYTVRHYDDGAAVGVVFPSITCAINAGTFRCTTPIPAYTPGFHTVYITSANVAGESAPSNTLGFNMVVTPAAPTNFRIAFYIYSDGIAELLSVEVV